MNGSRWHIGTVLPAIQIALIWTAKAHMRVSLW